MMTLFFLAQARLGIPMPAAAAQAVSMPVVLMKSRLVIPLWFMAILLFTVGAGRVF
jgi:hypothetical protein